MFIFLDESGCLGFDFTKKKTSKKFVITVLVLQNIDAVGKVRKAVQRTLKNKLNAKKRNKRIETELKGTRTAWAVKEYFYRNMPKKGWRIYTVVLNKLRVNDDLRTKQGKKKLYNFLARFILEKLDLSEAGQTVNLIMDRSKNKEEIQDFNHYVENQLQGLLPLHVPLYITHESSQENTGLQAVDLFCWGVARKYERRDLKWYDVFKKNIKFETEYLP